jgi:hypothetical protein
MFHLVSFLWIIPAKLGHAPVGYVTLLVGRLSQLGGIKSEPGNGLLEGSKREETEEAGAAGAGARPFGLPLAEWLALGVWPAGPSERPFFA